MTFSMTAAEVALVQALCDRMGLADLSDLALYRTHKGDLHVLVESSATIYNVSKIERVKTQIASGRAA